MNTNPGAERGNLRSERDGAVRITIDGRRAIVEPACAQILEQAFRVTRRTYEVAGPLGLASTLKSERLYVREGDRGLIPAGLVPRTVSLLEARGTTVDVIDAAPANHRLMLNSVAENTWTDADRVLAECVLNARQGQVVYRHARARNVALMAIVRLFPQALVTIVTARKKEAKAIRRSLMAQMGEAVGLYVGGGHRADERIRVGTFGSLDPSLADLVIVTDVTHALGKRAVEFLTATRCRNLIGFAPAGAATSRREALRLEALFGPVLLTLGATGQRRVARVLIADSPPLNAPAGKVDLNWKRQAIWHNAARNNAIAALASALVAGDEERLIERGVRFHSESSAVEGYAHDRRVVVLVESPEHGRELARLVPGWQLLSGPANTVEGRSTHGVDRFERETNTTSIPPTRSIITLLHATTLPRLDLDVLIRADGTPWPLDLPGFPPEESSRRTEPVLVVDFADDGEGDQPADGLMARLRGYKERDWAITGPTRVINRLETASERDESGDDHRRYRGHSVQRLAAGGRPMPFATGQVD